MTILGLIRAVSAVNQARHQMRAGSLKRFGVVLLLCAVGGPSAAQIRHRVVLVGDTGNITASDHPTLSLVRRLVEGDSASTVVFLGDNVYGRGLRASDDPFRDNSEEKLRSQLDAVKDLPSRVIFIPGNHDWDRSGPDGAEAVARQETLVQEVLERGNTFLPDDGLPGPVRTELEGGPDLVVIDTEWYLRTLDKPHGEVGRYDIDEDADFLAALADVVRRIDDDRPLIIAAHHPVRSLGRHGGHFPLRTHLFPLTEVWENAYVPLPVVGSLVVLSRAWFGGPQELSNPRYQAFREAVEAILRRRSGLTIYAAGHEHNLQVMKAGNVVHLVSGSGSSSTYVAQGHGSEYTSSDEGLMELDFRADGSVGLRVWITSSPGEPAFESELAPAAEDTSTPRDSVISPVHLDSFRTAAADPRLGSGPIRRFLMGSHNRSVWMEPVTVPVFDMGRTLGGLRPMSRGGGAQTLSIRLEDEDGRQFVLRSLTKDVSRTVPEILKGTVAEGYARDQMAMIHPYGALLVPPLSDAAGLFHTNPRVFFVPEDPRFGPYAEDVADRLMLLEVRPDDDMTWAEGYEDTEEVVGASKMYREVNGDNDHRVDEAFFARARLFDMLISDWDRHPDQWRWAVLDGPDGQGKVYLPIGRDRDWAFNRLDGLLPRIARFVMPKFQSFRPRYGLLRGLNQNGLRQDRRLTAELTMADWEREAEFLVGALDDSVFSKALEVWPESIRRLDGKRMARIFAQRRRKLLDVARRVYRMLSRQVDVVGSDKHERFRVRQVDRDRVEVSVDRITKEGEDRGPFFRRVFDRHETDEIRLYGLGGDDRFHVDGVPSGLSVFVIGGPGDDRYVDDSAPGRGGRVTVYDLPQGMDLDGGPVTRDRRSQDPSLNRYDPMNFLIPFVRPQLYMGRNPDDGVFVGGGATWTRPAFRKKPFGSRHTLVANVAGRTGAFNVVYEGIRTSVVGGWDGMLRAEAHSNRNFRNYFGLGNETENTVREASYYEARLSTLLLSAGLERRLDERSRLGFIPVVTRIDVQHDADRFIVNEPRTGIDPGSLSDHWYAGADLSLIIDRRDSGIYPRYGFRWRSTAGFRQGLSQDTVAYGRIVADLSVHHTPWYRSPVTISARAGLEHNIGEFPFYEASTVGGRSNLRGWRSTRFAGRTALYQNLDIRLRIGSIRSLLANGEYGIIGFVDQGRVWQDHEHSRAWHRGYGGGAWLSLFDMMVISATVGRSVEQTDFTLKGGFFF